MEFYFAGGAMEIGGSCIYLRIAGKGILMDCGIRQSAGKDPFPDFRGIQERGGVDAVMVSHAHMDHTGSLPVISKAYPLARIYMTKMAMEQTKVLLLDSLKLMDRREEEIPQYSREDVSAMLERVIPLAFQQEIAIPELDMKLTAYPAGHIAGAACLYLQTQEGSIFYSGDVSGFLQQTIEGIGIPRLRPDVAILESTYGNRLHASRSLEEIRLAEMVADCARKGQKILIPAFALGRAQEVLLILRKAIGEGRIPHIPVYADGMVRDMNRVYVRNPECLRRNLARRILKGEDPFYTEDIRAVGPIEDRDALVDAQGPAVFVASSGMLSGGPSAFYAQKLLPREDACVILTGYQDEEAPGRKLQELLDAAQEEERRLTLGQVTVPVRAQIAMVGLSAHADQSELCGIVEKMTARRVILVHGDETSVHTLGEQLACDVRRQIYQPTVGDEIEIRIGTRRTQLRNELPQHRNCTAFQDEQDAMWLWDFVRTHYPGRAFTIRQLEYLWFGQENRLTQEQLQAFQDILLGSVYFDRHARRMYLLVPCTEEEIREKQKAKEPSAQDVEAAVRKIWAEVWAVKRQEDGSEIPETPGSGQGFAEIRKLSFYPEEKRTVITVDFPDVLDEEGIRAAGAQLQELTGWTLEFRASMNFFQAGLLLEELFPGRITKTSYYADRKCYQITLANEQEGDPAGCDRFRAVTGWKLVITNQKGGDGSGEVSRLPKAARTDETDDPLWFAPPPDAERAEQNLAFSLIDMAFADSLIKPYKKGRKNDQDGLYMELSFLSPGQGLQCARILQELAGQIGWRLHISESVNQNQLQAIAAQLCRKYGVVQNKTASYLPAQGKIRIRNAPETAVPREMREEFLELTGVEILEL